MLLESKPTFTDFWISKLGYVSAKKGALLQKDDYVIDEHGIAGRIRMTSEEYGNFVVFIDGYSTYDTDIQLRKLTNAGKAVYEYQKLNFSLITRLARIINDTITDFYPFTFMFNNGTNLWVRGTTLSGIVDKFSTKHFSSASHSLFSAKLTPRYTCDIETLILKKPLRKSSFNRKLLKAMFIDVDLNMIGDSRIKWKISENEDYNKVWWKKYINQYRKYDIKYLGDL